VNQKVKWICL